MSDVVLAGLRIPLVGPVREQVVTPFAAALGSSPYPTRRDMTLAATAVWENFMGMGLKETSETNFGDKFWYGGALTVWRDKVTLNVIPTSTTALTNSYYPRTEVYFNGTLYVVGYGGLFDWDGINWTRTTEATLQTNAEDAVSHHGFMFIVQSGSNTVKWTGTGAGTTPATHKANAVVEFDDSLISAWWDATNRRITIARSVDDAVTWPELFYIPDAITYQLLSFYDASGNATPVLITDTALYLLDIYAQKAMKLSSIRRPAQSKGSTVHNGRLYIPQPGGSVLEVTSQGTIRDIGPGTSRDLPWTIIETGWLRSDGVNLYGTFAFGAAAGSASDFVMMYDGAFWHFLTAPPSVTTGPESVPLPLAISAATSIGDPYIHWFSWDNATTPNATPKRVGYNLFKKWTPTTYEADVYVGYNASDVLYSPLFDGGMSEIPKVALSIALDSKHPTTSETIAIAYDINESGSWTTLGTWTATTSTPITFGSSAGLSFRKIQFRVTFARGSTVANTPELFALMFKYLPIPKANYSWTIPCAAKGEEASALIVALKAVTGSNSVPLLTFYPDGDTTKTAKYVRITQIARMSVPDDVLQEQSTVQITVSEVM